MGNANLARALERARRRRNLPQPEMRKLLRENAGLTQDDLAKALRVSCAAISRYESGNRSPNADVAVRYAKVLSQLAAEPLEA